jgi:hypothetical protein
MAGIFSVSIISDLRYAWIDPPLVSQRGVDDGHCRWRDHLGHFLGVMAEHRAAAVDENAIGAADMVSYIQRNKACQTHKISYPLSSNAFMYSLPVR